MSWKAFAFDTVIQEERIYTINFESSISFIIIIFNCTVVYMSNVTKYVYMK